MTHTDQISLWRQIRLLHEWHYRLAVSNEALRRLSDEAGFSEKRMELEKLVSEETSQIQAESLSVIDDIIQRLMTP